MSASYSGIQVFVQWKNQTVFAGEEVECQITFKNVTATHSISRSSQNLQYQNGYGVGDVKQQKSFTSQISTTQQRSRTASNSRQVPSSRSHRSTLSLNVPIGDVNLQRGTRATSGGTNEAATEERSHRRSVSILSLGVTDVGGDETRSQNNFVGESSRKHLKGHARAASLQIVPRRTTMNGGPPSAPITRRSTTHPPPLLQHSAKDEASDLGTNFRLPERPYSRRPDASSASVTPGLSDGQGQRIRTSLSPHTARHPTPEFTFPPVASQGTDQQTLGAGNLEDVVSPTTVASSKKWQPSRPKEEIPLIKEQISAATRILSPLNNETPRSSGEFYSLSNNSTETLASEYVPQIPGRTMTRPTHSRRSSNIGPIHNSRPPETLMMGYAQVYGSFILDGSLVNQAPFEEIKRKGVLGGQGGGVIGVERNKRESGLLRSFGWGSLGESIGGLLGTGELSTIKEMRDVASSKAVPLLSTPQSILFVDLRLAPGESRTFQYSFKLPPGLPPTHRGKALKVSYNLVLGTQRPGGAREQQVRSVEIPFRVLGSVNEHGELLGHDLMSPYIILRDQAHVQSLGDLNLGVQDARKSIHTTNTLESAKSSYSDFLLYVDELLARPRQNSSLGLLSPTDAPNGQQQSTTEGYTSAKEAIDMAILRSNLTTDLQLSANRFEIARNGQRVAVVMLTRPAYRLGETIYAVIDFTDSQVPCYALHAALETSEKVDSSLALRSEASIHRVTRRIQASQSESTLFARRIVFSPTIPISATPSFITSGVSLEWKILIEFVTPKVENAGRSQPEKGADLLEEISRDERGFVFAAAEVLNCESFEIAVPLRVYGATGGPNEREDGEKGLSI